MILPGVSQKSRVNKRRSAWCCIPQIAPASITWDFTLNRKIDPADEPADVMTRVPDDCYALYLNSTNEEWWGWTAAHENPGKYRDAFSPAEKRVLDTIEWVITRYKIDRNRVYLSGVSMGGCGALGIGLPHGNIFAAMLVMVPAGTEFAALRMGFAGARGSSSAPNMYRPDPPVLVDFSAQNDDWSKTQPELLQAAQADKFPLIVAWAPFGHTAFSTAIAKYPQADVTLAFPWTEIRKNVAYPVFTVLYLHRTGIRPGPERLALSTNQDRSMRISDGKTKRTLPQSSRSNSGSTIRL